MLSVRSLSLAFLVALALPLGAAANVPPKKVGTIANATLLNGASDKVIPLAPFFSDPDTTGVRITTVLGSMDVALYSQDKAITVANFLNYVDSGRYVITDPTTGLPAPIFFHRSVTNFVLQTGGFLATSSPDDATILRPTMVEQFDPIVNEPGISNIRGTIAMAKIDGSVDSATDQWFINLADNSANLDVQNGGFTVFGRVLGDGMTVADAIAALPIFNFGSPFDAVPLRNYTTDDFNAGTPAAPENSITIPSITDTVPLTFTATSAQPGIASVSVSDNSLLVTPKALGTATITVTAKDADGATVTQTFNATVVTNPAHLANISTRVVVGTNQDALIGGFIVLGNTPKTVAVRALGPSLADAGLSGVLANPTLELHDGTGALINFNDNWQDAPNKQAIIDANLAPTKPNESVILATLPATAQGSAYTAVIHGASGGGGFGLVEVYDLDSSPGSNILNISTRGNVQTGNNIMIGGFIVFGDNDQRVLVRGLGPSLAAQGISDPLSDPTLSLVDGNGLEIDANDDWQNNPDAAEIEASGLAPNNPKESTVVMTLPAGQYTALVRGANGATGTGLVEAYALPPL